MIGKELIDMRDTDGKYFVKERVEIAKGKGSGWQDYKFMNPVSKKIEPKSMYLQRYEDVIVGCGIYKG
jgi:signal transduction histidine kinase